ncbi:MAG: amino acid permease, partial [Sulfobacillus sp.]|nr:amino acid permease [Sulfobacillus sp.]
MTTLKKVLSWQDGAAFAVTAVMGTGILILPALTADMAGPAALVAWGIMGILVVPMAWTLGDLAVLYPAADGIAGYVRHAFGDRWARLVGYLYLGTVPLGAPAAALIGMGYVTRFFHWGAVWGILGALMMLAVALTVNALGVELSG